MTTETSPDGDPGRPHLSAAERLAVALGTSETVPEPVAVDPAGEPAGEPAAEPAGDA